jgi:putative membrane protein
MAQERERVIKVARENPFRLGCIVKAVLTLGIYLLWWASKQLVVTTRRVVWRSGVFGKTERTVPLDRVTDISVSYGLLGRLLGYGDIRIETAGEAGAEIDARGITDPDGVRDAILRVQY